MATQIADLVEANEALTGKLARVEHLLSRNSGNSSSPPSRDDDPGDPDPCPAPGEGYRQLDPVLPGAPAVREHS